jgi:hypothetical protein
LRTHLAIGLRTSWLFRPSPHGCATVAQWTDDTLVASLLWSVGSVKRAFAGCVLVSDNESWVGSGRYGSTGVMTQWQTFVKNQKRFGVQSPKLVCIDIQPYGSTQAPDRANILNIGGFSDAVFNVVASHLGDDAGRFVAEVESIEL